MINIGYNFDEINLLLDYIIALFPCLSNDVVDVYWTK